MTLLFNVALVSIAIVICLLEQPSDAETQEIESTSLMSPYNLPQVSRVNLKCDRDPTFTRSYICQLCVSGECISTSLPSATKTPYSTKPHDTSLPLSNNTLRPAITLFTTVVPTTRIPSTTTTRPPSTTTQPPSNNSLPHSTTTRPPSNTSLTPSITARPPSNTSLQPSIIARPPSNTSLPSSTTSLPPFTNTIQPSLTSWSPLTTFLSPHTPSQSSTTSFPTYPTAPTTLTQSTTSLPHSFTSLPPTTTLSPKMSASSTKLLIASTINATTTTAKMSPTSTEPIVTLRRVILNVDSSAMSNVRRNPVVQIVILAITAIVLSMNDFLKTRRIYKYD